MKWLQSGCKASAGTPQSPGPTTQHMLLTLPRVLLTLADRPAVTCCMLLRLHHCRSSDFSSAVHLLPRLLLVAGPLLMPGLVTAVGCTLAPCRMVPAAGLQPQPASLPHTHFLGSQRRGSATSRERS